MKLLRRTLASFIVTLSALGTQSWAEGPSWIWTAEKDANEKVVSFAVNIDVKPKLTSAEVVTASYSADVKLLIDGEVILQQDAYAPLARVDLTSQLKLGRRLLMLTCQGVEGPRGVMLQLRLRYADGTTEIVGTNKRWTSEQVVVSRGPVDERLLTPPHRRVQVDATDNYVQWKQALDTKEGSDPATFQTTPSFEIQRLRSAQEGEDSWVSITFDPQGRAVIAKEQAGLLRMTLSADRSSVVHVEPFANDLKECRGLVFVDNNLYANANNSKAFYRLRGDLAGNLQRPTVIFTTSGGVGHGRNSLARGPDGKIYSIHGDSIGFLSQATDLTSPFRAARRGIQSSEGHVIRIDPKTLKIETVTAGLRNPYGIAFNSDGEMFTYDADAEHDMGAPWYRPTRVNHLVAGGDYGWRGVTGKWPPYYPDHPDNAPHNLDIGKGSPTAVMFGTTSNFPVRYREALFVLDWAYGRILAVHALPRGASYLCEAETFLKGRPLNVTGLDFGPDGSLYVVTGGRKTQSALYRIRYTGETDDERITKTPFDEECRQFAAKSRSLRRRLNGNLNQRLDRPTFAFVWQQLGSHDPWIRYAARNVVEHQPVSRWTDLALAEQDQTAAATALTALTRIGDKRLQQRVLSRLNEIEWRTASTYERRSAAYLYSRCLSADCTQLSLWYPDYDFKVNQHLSMALANANADDFVRKTILLLKETSSQREQMHYLYVLRKTTNGWTPELRDDYFAALAQTQHYAGGRGMPDFLKKIKEEALATLNDVERAKYKKLLEPKSTTQEAVEPRPLVKKWTLNNVLTALKAIDDDVNLERGAKMFTAASCVQCHRIGGRGTWIGPDLTAAGSRYSKRDLLESIIKPSLVIAENYRSLQIVTSDGKTHVGRPAVGGDYREPTLRLATNPQRPFDVIEIPKSEIEEQRPSPVSWMPAGLLDTLTVEEIRDLTAYITAGGNVR